MLIDPSLTGEARQAAATTELIDATVTLAESGLPLMRRIVPDDADHEVWRRYPADDAVDPRSGARWFYHAHPPEEREADEHGHFHLFLDRRLFRRGPRAIAGPLDPGADRADVVHLAALSIDLRGIPTRVFTVNRWVTDEWLYPAAAILKQLTRYDLSHAPGDPLVNRWLTAAVASLEPEIRAAVLARDEVVGDRKKTDPLFENRTVEVITAADIDLNRVVQQPDRRVSVNRLVGAVAASA